MKKSLVVEFIGIPGSGKTTISNRVNEILKAKGITCCENSDDLPTGIGRKFCLLHRYIMFFSSNLIFNSRAVSTIVNSDQVSLYDLKIALRAWLGSAYLLHTYRRKYGVRLIDQGIFQAIWQIGFGSRETKVVERSNRLFYEYPDILVSIQASPDTIFRRIANRDGIGRLDKNIQVKPYLMEKAFRLFNEVMLSESSCNNGVKKLVIDNDLDGNIDTKANIIVDFIMSELIFK